MTDTYGKVRYLKLEIYKARFLWAKGLTLIDAYKKVKSDCAKLFFVVTRDKFRLKEGCGFFFALIRNFCDLLK